MLSDHSFCLIKGNYFPNVCKGLDNVFWSDEAVVVEVKDLENAVYIIAGHEFSDFNSSCQEFIVLYSSILVEIYHLHNFLD